MTQITNFPKTKTRILIADDVQETRRNTRLMLSTISNVEVVAIASNGLQAVEMTEEQHPDIVILDINMPEMDGVTVFKHIVQRYPDTGCIVISAENNPETINAALSIGIQEYLTKPFIIEELELAVEHVIAHITEVRKKMARSSQLATNDVIHLEQVANDYMKAGRTDDEALRAFEQLAKNPKCDLRWLETLAMIYAIRREWGKLKSLAGRLEREDRQ
jgi:YesN/AraC family two-component response regulator